MVHDSAMDTKTFLAALSAAKVGNTDGLIKIVPKGQFAPVDGRTDTGVAHWTMTADLARQIIAAFDAGQTDLVVDYEHATLKAAETGQQNPAAGWISKYVWDDDRGLMGEVKWTQRAKDMIDSGESRIRHIGQCARAAQCGVDQFACAGRHGSGCIEPPKLYQPQTGNKYEQGSFNQALGLGGRCRR